MNGLALKMINRENFLSVLSETAEARPWQKAYLLMYSSLWQGIVTDPDLMLLPIDDHVVHRGDGVFDVMRCVSGKIYQMEAHLSRLERSARAISLLAPPGYERVRELIPTLVVKAGERDCVIRIMLSRGPGGFSTNPFECPVSHMYINVLRYRPLPAHWYVEGIPVVTSRIPIKKAFYANIKSCDYLPNVLLKMDAVKSGCHYAVGLDEEGFLAEGSTENVGILSSDGTLKFPGLEHTLAGVTLRRVFELAEGMARENRIRGVQFARMTPQEAYAASEMMLMGTSINILPVVSCDGRRIGNGRPGPVARRLSQLLESDMRENTDLLTEVRWER